MPFGSGSTDSMLGMNRDRVLPDLLVFPHNNVERNGGDGSIDTLKRFQIFEKVSNIELYSVMANTIISAVFNCIKLADRCIKRLL